MKSVTSPPPLPTSQVVIYDCLSGSDYQFGAQPMVFGSTPDCDVQIGAYGLQKGKLVFARSGKRLSFSMSGGDHQIEVNGAPFAGGLLPEQDEVSLVIDKRAFFFIHAGKDAGTWLNKLKSSPSRSWELKIFDGGVECFHNWKKLDCPPDFPQLHVIDKRTVLEVIDEVAKRSWAGQVGLVYHQAAKSGFFASQFNLLSQPNQLPDAGAHRCPRCWMRFDTVNVLAIHPSEHGDDVLGSAELKRFIPGKFGVNGVPLTSEGIPCSRLACPHCHGELPSNMLEKAPHMISIVGDSMAGKSYFLTVAVRQLMRILPAKMGINFTDADPAGNAALARMIATLFSPSQEAEDTILVKTELAGATYKEFRRHGKKVKLPMPFSYNLVSKSRASSSIILYDNAGEHFRPGYLDSEKSDATEHIAWASGILFLFDPLQHRDLLTIISEDIDPQVGKMKNTAATMMFDQNVILAEIADRLRAWRQLSLGQAHDVPLALVVGKHDLLGSLLPLEQLNLEICVNEKLSARAIDANSAITRSFLLEYCPDIVGAAENISDRVKYFPASAFGSPAIRFNKRKEPDGVALVGPDPKKLKPYLVEAPLLWLLSETESPMILKA